MYRRRPSGLARSGPVQLLLFFLLLPIFAACASTGNTTIISGPTSPAQRQALTFPNVGITDLSTLDPAQEPDQNATLAIHMLYSGLLKMDESLNILPDQATWQISPDSKTYTFSLKPALTFSDGTSVTAQSYIYSWTRALLPGAVASQHALFLENPIVGASDVNTGVTQTLSGLKALDDHTLQVTLTKPTPYFLAALTNVLFSPLNEKVVQQYGQKDWTEALVEHGIGTGPFLLKEWQHSVKMVFVPNPNYYAEKTKLSQVTMHFVDDPIVAFKAFSAGQYDFVWGLAQSDLSAAKGLRGFASIPLLQTDALFFDTTQPPFDATALRQAFAYATDKVALANTLSAATNIPATTLLSPGMPAYQADYPGIGFDPQQANTLLHSVYPDIATMPPITFSYPTSDIAPATATALQQMWQKALGINVTLQAVEDTAYDQELNDHLITFGFTSWTADFPDPYDILALNLSSTSSLNVGQWHNATFDQLIAQAEATTGDTRLALYNQAEQLAISEVGLLPLDHQNTIAVIPPWLQGVTLNGNGLYFGDWSQVYLLPH